MVAARPLAKNAFTTLYRKSLLEACASARTDPIDPIEPSLHKKKTIYDDEITFLKQVATLSSSPERLIAACAMAQRCSIVDIEERQRAYHAAAIELERDLADYSLSGERKHERHCRHRLRYGRQPLVCRDCWSYLPICLCPHPPGDNPIIRIPTSLPGDDIFANVPQMPAPTLDEPVLSPAAAVDLIVWTHHKEWGSPSNTGSVLVVALQQLLRQQQQSSSSSSTLTGRLLMKGLKAHEVALSQALQPQLPQEVVLPVVLWPSDSFTPKVPPLSVAQVLQEAQSHHAARVVVIAVEGTWNQARRMATKLFSDLRPLHLSDHELFAWRPMETPAAQEENGAATDATENEAHSAGPVSILNPLRKQKTLNRYPHHHSKDTSKVTNINRVCTVEAAVSALVALQAVHVQEAEYLLSLADQKVLRTVAYQGKMAQRQVIPDWFDIKLKSTP